MSDLERLGDGSDELARRVLRSGRRDAPPAGHRERFLASIGAGSAVGAAAPLASAVVKSSLSSVVIKWLGIGALAGLVTAGLALSEREPGTASPAPQSSATVAHSARPAPPPAAILAPPSPMEPAPPEAKSALRNVPRRAAAPADATLDEEVAVLDRARNALRSGQPRAALTELERHGQKFPGGVLGPEAAVLRMEALASTNASEARALAEDFLRRHPESPHAARVKKLLARLAPAASDAFSGIRR